MQAILYVKKWYGRSTKSGLLKGATFGSAVALAATAGLANAADDDLNTLVMAGFYEILDDGRAVFKAENGQDLYLSAEQYVILEGGLLLVSDELAEPVFNSLQVAGALRAQLINGTALVRDTSGDQVATAEDEPLWSGDGPAEMPSEEEQDAPDDVTVQEVVTASAGGIGFAALVVLTSRQVAPVPEIINPVITVVGDTGPNVGTLEDNSLSDYVVWTDGNDNIETFQLSTRAFDATLTPATADGTIGGTFDAVVNSGTSYWEAKQTSLSVTVTDSTGLTGNTRLDVAGQLVLPDALVADTSSLTILGADADDYVGYWAATPAATSPLTNFGRGIGRESVVDLGNGNNYLRLGHEAVNGAELTYTGGTGNDTLRVADKFSNWNGDSTLDMRAGGTNTLETGDSPAVSGDMTYLGGPGNDTLTMGRWFGNNQSNVLLNMTKGGDNALTAMWMAAVSGSEFTYLDGPGSDTLTFGMHFGANNGDIEIDMSRGGRNSMETTDLAVTASNTPASMTYIGGADTDTLSFGNSLGANGGSVTFDMSNGGNNTLNTMNFPGLSGTLSYTGGTGADDINMWDYVGNNGGSVTIDLSAGGDNEFTAGAFAAQSGLLTYTGGEEDENITFGAYLAANGGRATFDLLAGGGGDYTFVAGHDAARSGEVFISAGWGDDHVTMGDYTATHNGDFNVHLGGGDNTLVGGSWFAHSGTFTYDGLGQSDTVSFGDYSGAKSGTITLNLGNGDNKLTGGGHVAHSGTLVYIGGLDRDDLDFGDALAIWGGDVQINAGKGYNTLDAGSNVAQTGQLSYVGGNGVDELSFGTGLVENGGTATLDVGHDFVADKIIFYGSVADTVGTCTIENFNPLYDTIDVPHSSFTISATGSGACEVASSAGTHFSFTVNAVTVSDLTNAII